MEKKFRGFFVLVPCEFQTNEDNIPKYCKNIKNKNFMKDNANHTFFDSPYVYIIYIRSIEHIILYILVETQH